MRVQKLKLLIIALIAITATLVTQTTLAYFSVVGTATNVVTSGEIQLKIHERTASGEEFPMDGVYVIPGEVVSKVVSVENICDHPFYLRVKLVNSSDDQALTAEDCMDIEINDEKWTLRDDGYLYYNQVLQPGDTSAPVFSEVEIVGSQITQNHAGSILSLTVVAHAVQSENNPAGAPWEAGGWPAE